VETEDLALGMAPARTAGEHWLALGQPELIHRPPKHAAALRPHAAIRVVLRLWAVDDHRRPRRGRRTSASSAINQCHTAGLIIRPSSR